MKEDSPRIFVPPPVIIFGTLPVGLAIDGRLTAATALQPLTVVTSVLLAIAGLAIIGSALRIFSRSKTRPEPWKPASALVIEGIYKITRNPMYLGMLMIYAALALLFQSPSAGALIIPVFAIIDRLIIRREEKYLSRKFGEPYDNYRRHVRRWI